MITAYVRDKAGLTAQALGPGDAIPLGTVWLDLLHPDEIERLTVSSRLLTDLPTLEDIVEIETSSRLYTEGEVAFMTTPVIVRSSTGPLERGLLTFALGPDLLVTIRHTEPLWFAIFATRALKQADLVTSPLEAFLGLLEAVVDRAADVLERVTADLDRLSHRIFADHEDRTVEALATRDGVKALRHQVVDRSHVRRRPPTTVSMRAVITAVGRAGDLTQKVRDSLAGLERLVAFATTVAGPRMGKDHKSRLKTIGRDVHSLVEHAAFQAMQTNFLLDATLGVINIQQTNIIKMFSVASVAFLPPTLVASIYGMNFHHMPELDWTWGYPLALGLMVLAALGPLWYFRKRGWL
ncbi:magnesium transporter [Niveispirillum lacus]|uniref:Magnesium transport protein CorA n=1 Tax=Niveispirillum lacus TaxID=1981099 RepID=A0A255Z345_9PROT|nr:magnesium transporter CorA family protein [Niveispirillum lacus]OYQ35859.1 magnesium transporter [Niveispirillum lacus]